MFTKLLDRVPRFLSLFGLLGLTGLAGIFDPQLSRFSALSFLSYMCYFRFFSWFARPRPEVTVKGLLVPLLGIMIWAVSEVIYPGLLTISPLFGFIGFAGYLGLYESTRETQSSKTA
jgi:hypothetical protein